MTGRLPMRSGSLQVVFIQKTQGCPEKVDRLHKPPFFRLEHDPSEYLNRVDAQPDVVRNIEETVKLPPKTPKGLRAIK